VRADRGVGDFRQCEHVGAQLFGAEGAVEADGQRSGMRHRVPERLGGLPGKRAPAGIRDRARDHDRPAAAVLLEELLAGEDRGLGVQGVEHRLDQQQVRAAGDQPLDGNAVIRGETIERDVAKARIVHIGRQRGGAAGRPEHAGDEARLVRLAGGELVGGEAGDARTGLVQFAHDVLQFVVGLRHGGRVEGVGLDDIGTGREVGRVDFPDHVRARQRQEVVVATQRYRVAGKARAAEVGFLQTIALDHRAHGAIEHEDAFGDGLLESLVGLHWGLGSVRKWPRAWAARGA
jgi:hypothetical protein